MKRNVERGRERERVIEDIRIEEDASSSLIN